MFILSILKHLNHMLLSVLVKEKLLHNELHKGF